VLGMNGARSYPTTAAIAVSAASAAAMATRSMSRSSAAPRARATQRHPRNDGYAQPEDDDRDCTPMSAGTTAPRATFWMRATMNPNTTTVATAELARTTGH